MYLSPAPHSSTIFGLLMIGFLFVSVSYIYGTLLTANNNLKQLNMVAGTTVIINITLNLILIPRYHGIGAAISSLASQVFYAFGQLFLARTLLKTPMNWDIILKLALFMSINLVVGFLSLYIPGWVPGILVLLSSCVATSLILGLIRPRELLSIIKE
jgi:O-antigen/teichoic acid export membrane protein